MKRNLDHLLKQALSPSEEPKAQLNRKILVQAEEMANEEKEKREFLWQCWLPPLHWPPVQSQW